MDFDDDLSFDDLSFDDSDFQTTYREIDICGLVKKMNSKTRMMFNIYREENQLKALIKAPPTHGECFKMLSVGGGFSSLGIIKFIAEIEPIEVMYVSTFRIGKKHFDVLRSLYRQGKLKDCYLITSNAQERTDGTAVYKGKTYNYYDYLIGCCKDNNWKIKTFDNHSKLILMKTADNYYVVETSSNLNENPKMEQFSFENDEGLFNWYKDLFVELMKG